MPRGFTQRISEVLPWFKLEIKKQDLFGRLSDGSACYKILEPPCHVLAHHLYMEKLPTAPRYISAGG